MYTKDASAVIKAVGTDDGLLDMQFKALISVFNVVDSYGDVVMPGAFSDTLAEWDSKGDPIPVIWSHQWADIWAHIGHVVKAEETGEGLVTIAQLDEDNPTAVQAYKLMKQRRIKQFSFGFDVLDGGWGVRSKGEGESEQDVYELRKLALHEVGPCLLGVNRATELQGIKGTPPQRETSKSHRRDAEDGAAPHSKSDPLLQLGAWTTLQELIGETP